MPSEALNCVTKQIVLGVISYNCTRGIAYSGKVEHRRIRGNRLSLVRRAARTNMSDNMFLCNSARALF